MQKKKTENKNVVKTPVMDVALYIHDNAHGTQYSTFGFCWYLFSSFEYTCLSTHIFIHIYYTYIYMQWHTTTGNVAHHLFKMLICAICCCISLWIIYIVWGVESVVPILFGEKKTFKTFWTFFRSFTINLRYVKNGEEFESNGKFNEIIY